MSDAFPNRPWLSLYTKLADETQPRPDSVLELFRKALTTAPDAVAVTYFDHSLTYRDLDSASDALASWLLKKGIAFEDRVALILQNDPQFVIGLLAVWKVGALPVPMNPMYRSTELNGLFGDCAPRFIFCYADNCDNILAAAKVAEISPKLIICDPRNFQSRDDERVLPPVCPTPEGQTGFAEALEEGAGQVVPDFLPAGDAPGLLLYTSGTTGKPKGALLPHSAMAINGALFCKWCALDNSVRILAIAPLFHITGVVCHIATAFAQGGSIVLNYRFEPYSILDAIRATRPTYTIGAITALIALMNLPDITREDFASFESIYSGGAPIPPSVRSEFFERLGKLIYTSFGMTESTSATHLCPLGVEAPVDPESGALAIGVPVFDTDAKVIDEDGNTVPPGVAGELCVKGPQVMLRYWNKPEQTAETLVDGWLRTGDIAVMDEAGWFYLVDRKKDVIIASGFKVWPREVEDVLYAHPAIREAAVVGAPDAYRGETVKAYVSLKANVKVTSDDLVTHCRARLASYKAPRLVEIMEDLPKTVTGKIQRNELRQSETETTS
ncbi:long-chain fatty acid--CoA ligase [Altericroceibacterium spongiae]|uniref:3-methylmercaptopropionyl-CoA ligase n=1 Tax=Altericroceibacterium spongiae TaxID=2320269 RepID=A0A420EM98_9SPHN|nr:AMP-binding protein [Altericroceibacterium spongiae]RKF21770.1 long-chain fatty acid--CoA ligase [Altericroceibacterium spongiae]